MTWVCQCCLDDGDSPSSVAHRALGVPLGLFSSALHSHVSWEGHAVLEPLSFPDAGQ